MTDLEISLKEWEQLKDTMASRLESYIWLQLNEGLMKKKIIDSLETMGPGITNTNHEEITLEYNLTFLSNDLQMILGEIRRGANL